MTALRIPHPRLERRSSSPVSVNVAKIACRREITTFSVSERFRDVMTHSSRAETTCNGRLTDRLSPWFPVSFSPRVSSREFT